MRGSLKKSSAILVGLILSIPLAIFGFFAYQNVSTRASDAQPRDVITTKITESSALITWTTDQETIGVVEYGTSPTALVFFAPEAQKARQHEVELTLLTPKTTHYYQIRVGDKTFDDGGVPWTFTTRGTNEDQESTESAKLDTDIITSPSATTVLTPTLTLPLQSAISPNTSINQSISISPAENSPNVITPTVVVSTIFSCETESNCQIILQKLNKQCSSADYIRCIKRSAPTPSFTPVVTIVTVSPTNQPVGISKSPTPTPTVTPSPEP